MHRNEHAVDIAAPPEEVFPWLVEPDKRLRWMGALVESEALSEAPFGEGSRFRDVFSDHGQRLEVESELLEFEPGRRLAVRIESKGFEATTHQELAAADGGTRLTTEVETSYTLLAARLLAPIVTRHAQKQLERDLARLKELLESPSE